MRKLVRGLTRYGEQKLQQLARERALAFEQLQITHAMQPRRPVEETVAAISEPGIRPVFRLGDMRFGLNEREQRRHWFVGGATDTGKTTAVHELIISRVAASAARVAARGGDLDAATLDVEMFLLDPKDDAPLLKQRFAALLLQAPPDVQRVLRGAFGAIEMRRFPHGESEVTVKPLLAMNANMTPEYLAASAMEYVTLTAPGEWTDTLKFLFFQLARVVIRNRFPFDDLTIYEILTNDTFRLSLTADLPADLADFLGRLREIVAPQTIAALLRRIAMFLAHPDFRALFSMPPGISMQSSGKPRRVTIADCGTHSSIPSELRYTLAHALIVDDSMAAANRDARIPKVQLIEEYVHLALKSPPLRARHIDNLRVLRSAGVSVWFIAQSLDALPGADREEILTNIGGMLAFQSRSAADILFPHLEAAPGDTATDAQRRSAFTREMETLPRQEAVLWLKTYPALRVRSLDVEDPVKVTGRSAAELIDIYDTELAPHCRIPVSRAEKILAEWRAANLPHRTAKEQRKKAAPSFRDILGLGGDES